MKEEGQVAREVGVWGDRWRGPYAREEGRRKRNEDLHARTLAHTRTYARCIIHTKTQSQMSSQEIGREDSGVHSVKLSYEKIPCLRTRVASSTP
jgi:hypothetical protein